MINRKSKSKTVLQKIEEIESRFLEVSGLEIDLAKFPLIKNPKFELAGEYKNYQVKTDKEKSDKHGEVFTPLWLVDEMLDWVDNRTWKDQDLTTEDLCAGLGQFSIRMLRKKYDLLGEDFLIDKFLEETHLFSEFQLESCKKLLYIFGDIRLLIGDASQRGKLPEEAEKGVWVFNGENTFLINEDTWDKIIKKEINVGEIFMSKMKEAADVTFSNPPYDSKGSHNKDLKILKPLIESNCFKRLICVHPCTWLTQTKTRFGFGGSKLFKDFRNLVKDHLRRVFFFNGNEVFNIGLNADCIISDFDFSIKQKEQLFVKFLEDKEFTSFFKSIDEITIHGKNFINFENLIENLKVYIEKNGSLETKKIIFEEADKIVSNKFLVQFMIMRGNKITEPNSNFFVMEQLKINKENENGIRDNEINGVVIFSFNSKEEKENFLTTIKTDFMRLCLSILKFNSSIHFGELSFVPWLDWSKSYTDEELFTMFGILKGHPLREYSKKIISNYWGIEKNY